MTAMESDDDDQPIVKNRRLVFNGINELDEEEEDETVLEMDVIVCNDIPHNHLFRVQCPQRKKGMFSQENRTRCRYKKIVRMLEVRVAVDPNNGSFDKTKLMPEGSAPVQRDPKSKTSASLYSIPREVAAEEVYEGRAHFIDAPLTYAVGFIKNGNFYVSPLEGSFTLARNLDHMNERKNMDRDFEDERVDSDSDTNQTVRVKFARPETDRQKKRREASALHREKEIASDTWVPLDVFLKDDSEVANKLSSLVPPIADRKGFVPLASGSSASPLLLKEIVTHAILKKEVEQIDLANCDQSSLSMQRIRDLPTHLQVKALMLKARVLSLSTAHEQLPSFSRSKLVELLSECANLVQGNWVLMSDYLFQKLPPANSVGLGKIDIERSALWRCARDLSLAMLDAGQPITRIALSSLFGLSIADLDDILSTFGYADLRDRTWKLRIPKDEKFLNDANNLRTIANQKKYWKDRCGRIQNEIASAK